MASPESAVENGTFIIDSCLFLPVAWKLQIKLRCKCFSWVEFFLDSGTARLRKMAGYES
ncbi:transmembrane protein 17, isoform CRA_a, partial [Rattus norvegicus]